MNGIYKSIAIVLITGYAGYSFSPKNKIGGTSIGLILGIFLGLIYWTNGVKEYLDQDRIVNPLSDKN